MDSETSLKLTYWQQLKIKIVQPSWYSLYFGLAALDVLTVLISFGLNVKLTNDYAESVALNQTWATRQAVYGELGMAAQAVNAPGNDVFDNHDVKLEKARMEAALAVFTTRLEAAKQDIIALQAPDLAPLINDFVAIDLAMEEMHKEALLIFGFFDTGRDEDAGKRMATMDRKFAALNLRLADLSGHVRAIQRSIFERQLENANTLKKVEYLILVLVSLMIIGALFYGRQISRVMQQAEQERLRIQAMKTEFVSTVSHELRTPLTAMLGALGLVNNGAFGEISPPQAAKLVDMAHKNGKRLSILINDLLDLEKIVAGKLQYDMKVQAIAPLLEQAWDACQGYGLDNHVTLRYIAPEQDWQCQIDGARLVQVLLNLLSNAIKFSPQNGVVTMTCEVQGDWLRVSVADQGPGIPASFRNRIFQKFAQADSSDTRQKGGTGLGLSIAMELMHGMNGKIDFESVEGQGATFFLMLPLCPATSTGQAG